MEDRMERNPPTAPPSPPQASGCHRLRRIVRAAAALPLALAGLAGAAWWWAGTETSLAQTLTQAQRWLPEGHTLETQDITGSLLRGGQIGWLRWSSPSLSIELHQARLAWNLAGLVHRQLALGPVEVQRLTIAPQADHAEPATPTPAPPASLQLPLHIALPFLVHEVEWTGATTVQAQHLEGQYTFNGAHHQLSLHHLRWAQGVYALQAQLEAQAPMALAAELTGAVTMPLPGQGKPQSIQARARLQGTLGSTQAALELTASAQPDGVGPGPANQSMPQATLQATFSPWRVQPLVQGSATLQSIDLSALWPQAPRTQLEGQIHAHPGAGDGPTNTWDLSIDLRNRQPGPWDAPQLPLALLRAEARWDGQHWTISRAQARVDEAGSRGALEARLRYTPGTHALSGEMQLRQLIPSALHRAWASAPLHGQLKAHTEEAPGGTVAVPFELDIRSPAGLPAASAQAAPHPMAIQQLQARGRWISHPDKPGRPMRLELATAQIQAWQAHAQARNLQADWEADGSRPLRIQGQLEARAPGTTLQVEGHAQPRAGEGQLQTKVVDAQALHRWLLQLPGMAPHWPIPLRKAQVQGALDLQLQWRGGWEGLPWPASPRAASGRLSPLTLHAALQAPRLDYVAPDTPPVQVRNARWTLEGSLAKAQLSTEGSITTAPGRAQWQARAEGGWMAPQQAQWQIQELQGQFWAQGASAPWIATLTAPVTTQVSLGTAAQWQLGAGALRLTAPLPGQATLRWEPTRVQSSPQGTPWVQSRGELLGLPLAWLNALPIQPANEAPLLQRMGITTDLLLRGQWSMEAQPQWRARISLQRASGDLRLLDRMAAPATSASSASSVAGVEDAELALELDATDARARLHWKSQRAGVIEARLDTRWSPDGPTPWPADAPLAGTLRAQMPDVGVWSALAPPGWRVKGTLNADATLSGTRQAPRWNGTLAANEMAIRSVLDGVDLQGGTLQATLAGNEIVVTELRLQGGKGSKARIPGLSGNRTPPPSDGGELTATGRIRWVNEPPPAAAGHALHMELRAKARALQVLARADRQVSVSGQVQAVLNQGKLALTGQLKADRATILLPDESAPTLGPDVVLTSAAKRKAEAQAQNTAKGIPASGRPAIPPDLAIALDLGPDFALQGHGITTRLTGTLALRNAAMPGALPLVTGEIQTEQGRYRAWGQDLHVETGLIRFNGPYNNPSLDILALRPNITVRAGVQVTGSALAPRVKLYSDPDLPDAEKLSWVVLGRAATAGGAEAAVLQQAAWTLLGNRGQDTSARLAQRLGLDEIGFRGAATGSDANSAALTVGKRLSQDMYLSYERSLSGTLGTLYIFYDLSRRLTLRGQTGATSALDVIYTVRYD